MLVKSKREMFDLTPCVSVFKKIKGLMFSSKPKNDGLMFVFAKEDVVSIHMLFVFFPIDIVYVDHKRKIVEIKRKVRPFTPFVLGKKAKYILEVKDAKSLKVGEEVFFK